MDTSEYLKIQADLLIILRTLRNLDLVQFSEKTDEVTRIGSMKDSRGLVVTSNGERMKQIAEAARKFLEEVA